eukprot:SAG31_NODE_3870_length_3798_cov_2.788862_7_plen_49_part_00
MNLSSLLDLPSGTKFSSNIRSTRAADLLNLVNLVPTFESGTEQVLCGW